MLRLVSAGPIRIAPPWDSGDHATAFTITQISAEDWDAFSAAGDQQIGGKDGPEGARLRKEQLREIMAKYILKIENAREPGDTITARAAILEYLKDLTTLAFTWIFNCIHGQADVSAVEKKVSPSPCEPSPTSNDSTKKAGRTATTAQAVGATD